MGFKKILCAIVMLSCGLVMLYFLVYGMWVRGLLVGLGGMLFCLLISGDLFRKKKREGDFNKRPKEPSEEELEKYRKMLKNEYYDKIRPQLKKAGKFSELLNEAIDDYIQWEKQVDILDFNAEFQTEFDDAFDLGLEGIENSLNEVKEQIERAENQDQYTDAVDKFNDWQKRLDVLESVWPGLVEKLESIVSEINSLLQS